MLTAVLRFFRCLFGVVLAAVGLLATIVGVCIVVSLGVLYFSEHRLLQTDSRLLAWAAAVTPFAALLTWAGMRLANANSPRSRAARRTPVRRRPVSPRQRAISRVFLIVFWTILVGIWAGVHLPGRPGWPRVWLALGVLASIFAAMHARLLLHGFAQLFVGRLCGLKPLGWRAGSGPKIAAGESRDGFRWDWRWWPNVGWAEAMHFDERSYRWRQFLKTAAGPLADVLFAAGVWRLLTHHRHGMMAQFLLDPASRRLIIPAIGVIFLPALAGLLPTRVVVDGQVVFSDGWWLWRVFFMPAAEIRQTLRLHGSAYAARLWKSGRREAAQEQMAEALALYPDDETALLFLQSRLHRESGEPEAAEDCFRRALESSDALAPERRQAVLIGYAAGAAAHGHPDGARQAAEALLERTTTQAERIHALDALACLPILHRGTSSLLPDAERWCAEALALDPENVTLRGTWGSLLVELNREEEAVPILEEVLAATRSDGDRGIGSFYLALAARRLGRRKEMLRHRQSTLRWCKVPALLARIPKELPAM